MSKKNNYEEDTDSDDSSNYYDLDDKEQRVIGIKELDLATISPLHPQDVKGGSKLIVVGKPGCMSAKTQIIMFDGFKKNVEDICVGDLLMGDDSTPRTVLELCRGYDDMYKIIPTKGDPYIVNKGHILSLKCTGYNSIKKGTVEDIKVTDYLNKDKTWKNRFKGFRVKADFQEKEVNIHPWMIGYWLGDGTSSCANITTADKEVIDAFETYLYNLDLELNKTSSKYSYNIRNPYFHTPGCNEFLNFLKSNNLIKNKHIPHIYKANSRDVRLQLLAGIIDSDGYYDKNGKGYDIIQKSETLLDDIIFVARSLGFAAYKKKCNKSCIYNGEKRNGTYYRTFISGDVDQIPCVIERKRAEKRNIIKDVGIVGIEVEYQGKDNYYGFVLDGNHRFLLGDFTVTHNTGKSCLIKSILYAKKHIFPVGKAHSGTEDSNGFFGEIMPSTFIENGLNVDDLSCLENFKKRQKYTKQYLESRGDNPWCFYIIDDCSANKKIFKKPIYQELFKNGRHWRQMHILSLQYSLDIPPEIRVCIDGVFILREANPGMRKKLYENYGSCVDSLADWNDLMDQLTDDYCAIFINNRTNSNNMEDCIFYYKADPKVIPRDWKIGCKEYWDFHYERFDPNCVDAVIT
jgi:hypothetical protein